MISSVKRMSKSRIMSVRCIIDLAIKRTLMTLREQFRSVGRSRSQRTERCVTCGTGRAGAAQRCRTVAGDTWCSVLPSYSLLSVDGESWALADIYFLGCKNAIAFNIPEHSNG